MRMIDSWELINLNLMDKVFELVIVTQGERITVHRGPFKDVRQIMNKFCFTTEEVELAVKQMEERGHDLAQFNALDQKLMLTRMTEDLARRLT